MEFNEFLGAVPKITNLPLPGEDAHSKMAPPERKALMEQLDVALIEARAAAVLMLVYPKDGGAHLALIKRNSYKGVHSSQIAFPGGKVEVYDESLLATALRETEEEIGVPRNDVTFVCAFTDVYIPPSNFRVFPFLGYCLHTPTFVPDPREVAGIVEYPLAWLLDDNRMMLNRMATSYSEMIAVPTFVVGETMIWGATAMMLSELKEVLKAVF